MVWLALLLIYVSFMFVCFEMANFQNLVLEEFGVYQHIALDLPERSGFVFGGLRPEIT